MVRHGWGRSFTWALAGFIQALLDERNMRIHAAAALTAVTLGLVLHITRLEWGLLSITIAMVFVSEMINSAIERTVDLVTLEYHPLAKTAKNIAAGAVLLAALNAVVLGIIVFGPYVFKS